MLYTEKMMSGINSVHNQVTSGYLWSVYTHGIIDEQELHATLNWLWCEQYEMPKITLIGE